MDEERTRFGTALFGSRAFAGHHLTEALEGADTRGTTVRAARAGRGFDPVCIADGCRVGDVAAYLELHVEQGLVLHAGGRRLGLVESIAGAPSCGGFVSATVNP
jgi:allantoate deiminase